MSGDWRELWPAVLHAVQHRSRRQAKRLIREAGGHGSAAEVDEILAAIAADTARDVIESAATELEAEASRERDRHDCLAQGHS